MVPLVKHTVLRSSEEGFTSSTGVVLPSFYKEAQDKRNGVSTEGETKEWNEHKKERERNGVSTEARMGHGRSCLILHYSGTQ